YVEGESFTINALVSDDREIAQVVFIKRVGQQEQVIKTIGRQDAARLVAANEYFSAALRVPHNPADQPMSVLVRATDSVGQVTEVPLDLQILDDQEAPVVNMTVPAQNLEHYPGESFDVSGTASDNQYIGELAAYFVDEQGQEIRVDWEVLGRKDRLEQVRVANQNTIGSIVAAERFFTDYSARVRIPTGFVDYTGQSLTFKVRASDHGINSSDSPSIQVRIKADQEAPAIQILTPGETLYDRQPVTLDLAIVDNVSVRSYQVRIIDHENRVVLEKTDLDQASVKGQVADVINLARYAPLGAEGTEFTVAVE